MNKSTQLETYVIWWRGDAGFGHASITDGPYQPSHMKKLIGQ